MITLFFILGFIGSIVVGGAGINMALLHSISGGTVAEAFDNAFGWGLIGFGLFSAMLLAMIYHHVSRKQV